VEHHAKIPKTFSALLGCMDDDLARVRRRAVAGVVGDRIFRADLSRSAVLNAHASTIVETTAGTLLTAFFAGTAEGNPDVGIWVCRREADGWSAPHEAADRVQPDGTRHPCWNPVLFQPRNGPLMLFYKVGPKPWSWWGIVRTSEDDGRTWSEPRRLPDGILGPIKNKPIELADGVILSPSSSQHDGRRVHFERSVDGGRTWTLIGPVNDGVEFEAIQPSLLQLDEQRLSAIGRTRQGCLFQVTSSDGGTTWGKMTALDLPNPNSGTDAVTLADGRHLLIYNHALREGPSKGRSPLNVAVSTDGVAWRPVFELETEPGEFSYPAVIQTRDGLVHVTCTSKRESIKHVVLDPAKL